MSGATPLLPLYVFMACAETTSPPRCSNTAVDGLPNVHSHREVRSTSHLVQWHAGMPNRYCSWMSEKTAQRGDAQLALETKRCGDQVKAGESGRACGTDSGYQKHYGRDHLRNTGANGCITLNLILKK